MLYILPKMPVRFALIFLSFQSVFASLNKKENESCGDSQLICKRLKDCPWAKERLKQSVQPTICSFSGLEPIVCCKMMRPNVTELEPAIFRSSFSVNISQKCREYAQYVYELEESPILLVDNKKINRSTCATEAETLLVNGVDVAEREFPHMVRIGYTVRTSISWRCGGSLVSEQFVLSAAHCSNDTEKGPATWAGLGGLYLNDNGNDFGREQIKIIERIIHPEFNPSKPFYSDIALFKLERPAGLNSYVRPICLPETGRLSSRAVATGWGNNRYGGRPSNTLQKITLSVISIQECQKTYQNVRILTSGILDDLHLCAYNKDADTCQGDSGGPLQIVNKDPFCTYTQIGVTSFGKGCASTPGVYTNVAHFLPWIKTTVWGG